MALIQKVTDPLKRVELIGQRRENTKTYDLGNGKRQLVASVGAVHYKDNYANAKEPWKDIDLAWEDNKITKAPFELSRDGKKYTFRDKKTGEVSTLEPLSGKINVIVENTRVRFQSIVESLPFEANYRITGRVPDTRAYDDEGDIPLEVSVKDGVLTEKLTSLTREVKGTIKVDPTYQVGASSDDCRVRYLSGWGFSLTATDMSIGQSGVGGYQQRGGGMRFLGVNIPKSSIINTAYLRLRASASIATANAHSYIRGQDSDDTTTFSTLSDYFDRPRTTAKVAWDGIPAWSANTDYNSPSIVNVIQEIIDRAGWQADNSLVIFWDDHDGRSGVDGYRTAYAYDGSATYAPKLVVTYTPPAWETAYKDIATRFLLNAQSYRDIATRFTLFIQGYQDVATRFRLWAQGYSNAATRFLLQVRGFKDAQTRFLLWVRNFQDTATRFLLQVRDYTDVAARFKLFVQSYQDIAARFRLTAQSFKDISTRFWLQVWNYADIPTRFRLIVQGSQDATTRFKLWVQGFQDTVTRFILWIRGFQNATTRFNLIAQAYRDAVIRFKVIAQGYLDASTRFRLRGQGYTDAATRFLLTLGLLAYKDIATRLKLTAQAYRDAPTRFRLYVQSYKDIGIRFILSLGGYQDASARFFLYQPTWKELQIQAEIADMNANIADLRRRARPKARFTV